MSDAAPTFANEERGQWASRLGFVLAAAGSAVGLGNIWKFPYITGENGGGLFVLVYLLCIASIGVPVMIAEVIIGRRAQRAPVGAFGALSGNRFFWRVVGWMGVITGFIILSYYAVVAGWAMHYTVLSVFGLVGKSAAEIQGSFGALVASPGLNLFWQAVAMALTIAIVLAGVKRGIEKAARVLMPTLFVLFGVLLIDALTQPGFPEALRFLFAPRLGDLSAAGLLEALGHAFFTLSLGMGAMLTYGSYLSRDTDLVGAAITISVLDTAVAILACLVLFPFLFSFGMSSEAGPGMVFVSIPLAFSQMTGGHPLSVLFFALLVFAALTSAISLLEVVASTLIDELEWSRHKATLIAGVAIAAFGVPSALSNGTEFFGSRWADYFVLNFFDLMDHVASNWLLPLGGLLIALYVGWFMPIEDSREEFTRNSRWARGYTAWLWSVRLPVPIGITAIFFYKIGLIGS